MTDANVEALLLKLKDCCASGCSRQQLVRAERLEHPHILQCTFPVC